MKFKIHLSILLLLCSSAANAWTLHDLFTTRDQQGAEFFQKNQLPQAAERFRNPNWKGVAYYKSGDYRRAIGAFSQNESELNLYNRSLAYARIGEFDKAIDDLDRVLAADPNNQKAIDNRAIFKKLQKQQTITHGQQERSQYDNLNKKRTSLSQKPRMGKGSKPEDKKSPDELNDGNRKRPMPGTAADKNQQQNANQSSGQNQDGSHGHQSPQPKPSLAQQEQEQAKQQWLKRIPDDPGGLLREKFLRDYQRRQQERG